MPLSARLSARRSSGLLAVLALMAVFLVPMSSATASGGEVTDLVNRERANRGLSQLGGAGDLQSVAQAWSNRMAGSGQLAHNPDLTDQVEGWRVVGENVGRGGDVTAVHQALMNSSGHRANILGNYNQIGIGIASASGQVWVTQVFRLTSSPVAPVAPVAAPNPCPRPNAAGALPTDSPAVTRDGRFFLRGSYSTGGADVCFPFGAATDIPVMGDWDGNGTRTPGVFRSGTWFLRNRNSRGSADVVLAFGSRGDQPVVGDWNNDGVDTVGVLRAGTWHLRNRNTSGPAEGSVAFGAAGDVGVTGDWNRDGTDTLGVFRNGTWYLTNRLDSGTADGAFRFGQYGDQPVVGDWNRDGTDTFGVVRSGQWFLTNRFDRGVAEGSFRFGAAGDRAVLFS